MNKDEKKQAKQFLRNLSIKQPNGFLLPKAEDDLAIATIDAFQRSETNTTIYAAACFTPVLGLLSSVVAIAELKSPLLNITTFSAILILGFSGLYFALYRSFFLGLRRMSVEGFRLGLLPSYDFKLGPTGFWYYVNRLFVFAVPVGFVLVGLVSYLVLFGK